MIGTLNQLKESQLPEDITQITLPPSTPQTVFTPPSGQIPSSNNLTKRYSLNSPDPLRELVLCSKNGNSDPEKLNHLAVQAANLQNTEEVSTKPPSSGVKTIAGVFTGTENLVKKVEENIKKRFTALDPSDSDEFGGIIKIRLIIIGILYLVFKNRYAFIGKNITITPSKIGR